MVDLNFKQIEAPDAVQTISESVALSFGKRGALVNYDPRRKCHTGIKKELADSVTDAPCVIRGHKGIAPPDNWVLDFAEPILEALAPRAVDMTTAEDNMVAALRCWIDTEPKTDKSRVIG